MISRILDEQEVITIVNNNGGSGATGFIDITWANLQTKATNNLTKIGDKYNITDGEFSGEIILTDKKTFDWADANGVEYEIEI